MYFYHRLYLSPSVTDPERVKADLVRQKGDLFLYVLMLSPGSDREGGNQIEFCHSAVLQQPYYRKYPPVILGFARTRKECISLVQRIVEESYRKTGACNLRAYLFPEGISAGVTVMNPGGGKP